MRYRAEWVAIGCAALAMTACVEKASKNKGKKISEEYVTENLLPQAPTMQNVVNADLGGKIVYLGNDVDTKTLTPGGKVTVTHYWKVTQAPGADWKVFAHVVGSKQQDWMNVDYTDMRAGYPPKRWKAGDIIRDIQKFALNKDWSSPYAQLSVGLYRKGGRSVSDRMPIVSGPHDDQSRVNVFKFEVKVSGATATPTPAPTGYVVRKATGPITIDGKADEPDWQSANKSTPFVDAEGSPATGKETVARLLYDDQNLYVFANLADDDVFSQYKNQDDPLWKEDVLELFIDADNNQRGYVELQVNPNNAHFDAWFATTRAKPGDVKWSANMKSAVVVHGSADKRGDKDIGWDVEIAIPLTAVKGGDAAMNVNIPPRVGDKWRLNIVRGEKPEKDRLRASSWNQLTYQDFHAPNRMLSVVFGDEKGAALAPAPSTGSAPAAPVAPGSAPADPKTGAAPAPGTAPAPGVAPAAPVKSPTQPALKSRTVAPIEKTANP